MSAAYRRGKSGNVSIRIPTPDGKGVIRSTGTAEADFVEEYQAAVKWLKRVKAWDVLAAIVDGRVSLDDARTAWAGGAQLDRLRARLDDVDLTQHIAGWQDALRVRFGQKGVRHAETHALTTPAHYLSQLRTLMPEGQPFGRSRLTAATITAWLAGLAVKPATALRYWAAVSSFAGYLVRVGVLERNVVKDVPAPRPGPPRMRYLTLAETERYLARLPMPWRAASALAHASGMELSALARLRRRDVDLKGATAHAHGTKRATRDRVVHVDAWALPVLAEACAGLLPDAYVFPRLRTEPGRAAFRNAHHAACEATGVADYRVHDARHSYAVRYVAAGASAEFVAAQLGHSGTGMVTRVYGRFTPTAADAARYQAMAQARDDEQRARQGDR